MKKKIAMVVVLVLLLLFTGFVAIKTFGKTEGAKIRIFSNKKETYTTFKKGDVVDFHDSEWYVLYDSSEKDDYVTLISADILYLGDEGITEVIDGIYETSDLNKYLKNEYATELGHGNLVERNGYAVRLFDEEDMKNLLDVSYDKTLDAYEINNCPDYICLTNNYFATMIDTKESEVSNVYDNLKDFNESEQEDKRLHMKYYNIYATYETTGMSSITSDTTLIVRPVINLKKEALEK